MRTEWPIRTCTIQVCQPLYMYKTQYVYVTQHSWAINYRACIDTHSHWHAAFLTWSRPWRTVGLSHWVTAHVQQRPLMPYMYVYHCMTTDQLILLYYYTYIILCILQLVKSYTFPSTGHRWVVEKVKEESNNLLRADTNKEIVIKFNSQIYSTITEQN